MFEREWRREGCDCWAGWVEREEVDDGAMRRVEEEAWIVVEPGLVGCGFRSPVASEDWQQPWRCEVSRKAGRSFVGMSR